MECVSVADPGSGAFLTLGSGIRNRFFRILVQGSGSGSATLCTTCGFLVMCLKNCFLDYPSSQCSGSGIWCFFDPGIRNSFTLDPGSQTHIFESLVTVFLIKSSIILKIGPEFFLQHFKDKIIFNYVKFGLQKRSDSDNKFFFTLLFCCCLDLGSGMGKKQDPGSGINIPDPQHCKQDW
jgi:hypothetical protein